jgi:hypothetical protein
MDDCQEHIKTVIKEKILRDQNPYAKCFVVSNADCGAPDGVQSACDSLGEELGFRFKIDFQPEYCFFKAHKIPQEDEFQRLRERYNYARARS